MAILQTIMINFKSIIFVLSLFPLIAMAHTGDLFNKQLPSEEKITLTVAIEEVGYFPFNYTENGILKGFTVDVLKYIEANSKYKFSYIKMPWPRALHLVSQGKVDLIPTLFKNKKRIHEYLFVEPSYAYEVNQLFALENKNIEFNGLLSQLNDYKIGTVREYSYGEKFDAASQIKKFTSLNEEVLVSALINKRVDAIVGNPFILNRVMEQQNVSSKIEAIKPYLAHTPVYLALTKKRKNAAKIKLALEEQIRVLKLSPYYIELLNKYQLNFKHLSQQ